MLSPGEIFERYTIEALLGEGGMARVYEEKAAMEEQLGGHRPPPCPQCGNHTVPVKLARHHAAV